MRLRTGHLPSDWLELGPGYGGSVKLGGDLVRGNAGPVEAARAQKAVSRKAVTPEQRKAAYQRTKKYRLRKAA